MSVLLGMLTPKERTALDVVARACADRYRPLNQLLVSRTAVRALAKLGLVDMRKGDIDGARLVRLSLLAKEALAKEAP